MRLSWLSILSDTTLHMCICYFNKGSYEIYTPLEEPKNGGNLIY